MLRDWMAMKAQTRVSLEVTWTVGVGIDTWANGKRVIFIWNWQIMIAGNMPLTCKKVAEKNLVGRKKCTEGRATFLHTNCKIHTLECNFSVYCKCNCRRRPLLRQLQNKIAWKLPPTYGIQLAWNLHSSSRKQKRFLQLPVIFFCKLKLHSITRAKFFWKLVIIFLQLWSATLVWMDLKCTFGSCVNAT